MAPTAAARIEEATSVGFLAQLFCELCLASYTMLRFRPSEVAAAALFLASPAAAAITGERLRIEVGPVADRRPRCEARTRLNAATPALMHTLLLSSSRMLCLLCSLGGGGAEGGLDNRVSRASPGDRGKFNEGGWLLERGH